MDSLPHMLIVLSTEMCSCSYMINAYDNLPDVVVFMHSDRYQWHNDNPLYGN